MKETVQKILEAAVNAPSGSNSQPWRFEVSGNEIKVIALPEKDHPILNYRNRGTLIAHGALIENILIAGRAHGFEPSFNLFPDSGNPNLTAKIILRPQTQAKDELATYLPRRTTNRKRYQPTPLNRQEKDELLADAPKFADCRLSLAEGETIGELAKALAHDVPVNLANQELHRLFFEELVWDEIEEKKRQSGLYVKTMEFKPPQVFFLKLFKNWSLARIFNKIGMLKAIYQDTADLYAASGLIGAISVPDNDEKFVEAGRLLERVWLRATKLNLGFHLVTGILFFWQRINSGEQLGALEKRAEIINQSYDKIRRLFNEPPGVIAVIFRLGKAEPPSARSSKKPPEIKYLS